MVWALRYTTADVRSLARACIYCGSRDDLTLEHIIPLSRGGANHRANLAMACWPCNKTKRDRLPHEFTPPFQSPHLRLPSAGAAAPRGYSALGGVDL
jgi:5-methylcytosine-specific restriction endonuclease McrA